jgi:hypothetical protein
VNVLDYDLAVLILTYWTNQLTDDISFADFATYSNGDI